MRSQIELARPFLDEAARKTTPLVKPVRTWRCPRPITPTILRTSDDPPDQSDNRIGFPQPSVSATLWGHLADPPDLTMRQAEGQEPGP
jgi:hypothetical protein